MLIQTFADRKDIETLKNPNSKEKKESYFGI